MTAREFFNLVRARLVSAEVITFAKEPMPLIRTETPLSSTYDTEGYNLPAEERKATDDAKNSQIRRLYLSAPISVLQPEDARCLFDRLAEEVRTTTDWVPVNPYDNGLHPEADWGEHMIRDLQLLRECDAVLMPCDISRSPGCRIEQIFARRLGLYIYTSLEELRCDAF